MRIHPFTRGRMACAVAAAAVAATLSLTPVAAFAETVEPAPADAGASVPGEAPAAPSAPAGSAAAGAPTAAAAPAAPVVPVVIEPAPAPVGAAPPEVVVVDAVETTAEDVLSVTPEEPTVTLFAEEDVAEEATASALPAPGDPCFPAVCIDNGTVLLAVNPTGELNTSDGDGSAAGPGDAGLEFLPTGNDSTSPGCLCEGWGVADPATGVWGGANIAELGPGGENLTLESFESTASTATSVVVVNDADGMPYFRVTHEYVPAAETPNLYQVNVTIENLAGAPIATVQYRRVMDWDIEPTAFNEYTTIDPGTASALVYVNDNGFESSNPLVAPTPIDREGAMVDAGPGDIGALFDFDFGGVGVGESLRFVIFYGGAASEADAVAALSAVGAEAYSFGQSALDPSTGTPNTFIFAFGKIGGTAIFPTPEEPQDPAAPEAPAQIGSAAPAAPPAALSVAAPARSLAATGMDDGTSTALAGWSVGAAIVMAAGAVLLAIGRLARRPLSRR